VYDKAKKEKVMEALITFFIFAVVVTVIAYLAYKIGYDKGVTEGITAFYLEESRKELENRKKEKEDEQE
jgi:mannose/fructose/N-acetylgalactosamine-specific phosphotransferase system component IID